MNTSKRDDFSPPESVKGLWYDPIINRFSDESGAIIHDLGALFPVWQLDQWKKTRDYAYLRDKKGEFWELFYNTTNQYRLCQHFCDKCQTRCEIYDLFRDWK